MGRAFIGPASCREGIPMRWRRGGLVAFALLVVTALAVDLSWLYRFATREPCPPIRSCLGWPTPWERFHEWLGRGRLAERPPLCWFTYESREFITLLGPVPILVAALTCALWRLGAIRGTFRVRTALLAVALLAFEWAAIRELWTAVDAWEAARIRDGSLCCLDTWIWGEDL
jgi:hypothetical protein